MDRLTRLRRALAGPHPQVLRVLMDVTIIGGSLAIGSWAKSWALDVGIGNAKTTVDVNTIILAIISLIGTIYLAKINSRSVKTKEAAETTATDTATIKTSQIEATEVLKETHKAVNTNYQAMQKDLENMRELVMALTTDKTKLTADARTAELAKVGADATLLAKAEQRPAPAEATPVNVVNPAAIKVKETP